MFWHIYRDLNEKRDRLCQRSRNYLVYQMHMCFYTHVNSATHCASCLIRSKFQSTVLWTNFEMTTTMKCTVCFSLCKKHDRNTCCYCHISCVHCIQVVLVFITVHLSGKDTAEEAACPWEDHLRLPCQLPHGCHDPPGRVRRRGRKGGGDRQSSGRQRRSSVYHRCHQRSVNAFSFSCCFICFHFF